MSMKFLLFGTGDYYNRYKKWFENQNVIALLDNSEYKKHTMIDGLTVLTPEEGIKLEYDIIVILSFYVKQMRWQLMELGVEHWRIVHFYELRQLLGKSRMRRQVQYFQNAKEVIRSIQELKSGIVLLSHDLTMGGPAIALFHAAVVLKTRGYAVVFASMLDGPLRDELQKKGIPVIVDENLQIATMQETAWMNAFSLIICNTLNFYVFLSERDTNIPVIWWLHDARFFYDGVNRETIGKISLEKLTAVSVGPIPAVAISEFLPGVRCSCLLYGVEDAALRDTEVYAAGNRRTSSEKVQFIIIGFLEDIKGQDILVQSVQILPEYIRNQCVFYIVGHDKTLFGEKIHKESETIREINFTGTVGRQELHRILRESEVLICPSRQDSMPTVAAEAMMHSVPCIVSDVVGTAAYIHDGEEGWKFPSEDAYALAGRIEWCVENKVKLNRMGRKARMLYEKEFSMQVFEKRFMDIIQEMLGVSDRSRSVGIMVDTDSRDRRECDISE